VLVVWNVDSADSGHACPRSKKFAILTSNYLIFNNNYSAGSTLALLVPRVLADHAHHALPADDLAVAANPFNRCQHFHI